jgi:hypothetical protein
VTVIASDWLPSSTVKPRGDGADFPCAIAVTTLSGAF